jgi:tRNA (cmo5U34)-methyltransferase
MQQKHPSVFFDEQHAADYDRRFAKLAAFRESMDLLVRAILAELPADASILCVGAGTGTEILALATRHPLWRFTAVEPSGPMLDVCRRRTAEMGIDSRCTFHEGFLDSLPPTYPFDAATSLLVSQFILDRNARSQFFSEIGCRLRTGGLLISADLASDTTSESYSALLRIWLRMMSDADVPAEKIETLRIAYQRDVAILPTDEVRVLIESGGFDLPVLFHQAALIHGWYARKN